MITLFISSSFNGAAVKALSSLLNFFQQIASRCNYTQSRSRVKMVFERALALAAWRADATVRRAMRLQRKAWDEIMEKIKVAVFGTGFMGRVHVEALRRLGNVEVVAIAGRTAENARAFAVTNSIERSTGDYRELLADRRSPRCTSARRTRCTSRWPRRPWRPISM